MKREQLFRRYLRFWRADPARDVHEELDFHVNMRVTEFQRMGMSREEAERAARERFGDVNGVRSEVEHLAVNREVRRQRAETFDGIAQDIRYTLRTLRARRGFAAAIIITLALGIGANLAIFTVVDSVLLRPLPLHDPDRLVRLYDDLPGAGATDVGVSVPELQDLSSRAGIFDAVSGIYPASAALAGGEHVERIELLGTSANYFELLQAKAALGRVYGQAEWQPGFLGTVVISDALWRRQFGADRAIIGKTIRLDEDPYTIIGVMPPEFRHPGNTLAGDVDAWAGAGFSADPFPSPPPRASRLVPGAIARLKPGVTIEQAQARLDQFVTQLGHEYPADYRENFRWSIRLESVQSTLTGNVRTTLAVLLGAVSFLLLIVCVNVASLMLARSSSRMREFALRQALGASRARIARQMMLESLTLALAGGIAAMLVLHLSLGALTAVLPPNLPRLNEIHADWRVVVAAIVLSLGAALLIGLAPAVQATGADANRALNEGGRSGSGSTVRRNRARTALVVAEIALSVVLLIGAGLLVRSFSAVLHVEPGIDPTNVVTGEVWVPVPNNPAANKYLKPPEQAALAERLLGGLRQIPGVEVAALATPGDVPFLGSQNSPRPFQLPDEPATKENDHAARYGQVSADYFAALRIATRSGRVFTSHDDLNAPNVVVVNEAFARRFSPQRNLVGQRLRAGRNTDFTIIGVVADVRADGLDAEPTPRIYLSLTQRPTVALSVFVRSRGDLPSIERAITKTVHDVDTDLPVFGVRTMNDVMSSSMERRRFSLALIAAFAVVAVLMAALGIYGVMAFVVSQREQEFGVRQALGATGRDILVLAVRPGIQMAVAGTVLGAAIAFVVTRLISSLLYGVSARDPVTFLGVAIVLGLVAIAASLVPARRATKADPAVALRN